MKRPQRSTRQPHADDASYGPSQQHADALLEPPRPSQAYAEIGVPNAFAASPRAFPAPRLCLQPVMAHWTRTVEKSSHANCFGPTKNVTHHGLSHAIFRGIVSA